MRKNKIKKDQFRLKIFGFKFYVINIIRSLSNHKKFKYDINAKHKYNYNNEK